MRALFKAAIVFLMGSGTVLALPMDKPGPVAMPRAGLICLKSGEQAAGLNKICYYNCAGSQAAITVSAASLCPITIDR